MLLSQSWLLVITKTKRGIYLQQLKEVNWEGLVIRKTMHKYGKNIQKEQNGVMTIQTALP